MTKNKVKSHFFQQLSTDAGFGEHGCQAHLYLDKFGVFSQQNAPPYLAAALSSFESLFSNHRHQNFSTQKPSVLRALGKQRTRVQLVP